MHEQSFSLIPHPGTQDPVDRIQITGRVQIEGAAIRLQYDIAGDCGSLQWPPFGTLQRRDGLWRQTCLEFFMRGPDARQYWEFNFAPQGGWNAYVFDDYRSAMRTEDRIDVVTLASHSAGEAGCRLTAEFSIQPLHLTGRHLLCGISAVAAWRDQGHQYFALSHCAAQPDFHQFDSFSLRLPCQPTP